MMLQYEFTGLNSLDYLKIVLENINSNNIFLVTGKESYERCGAKSKLKPLLQSSDVTHFDDFVTNPKLEDIKDGIKIFNQNRIDLVLAVGGGSVIDVAKSINLLAAQSGKPEDYVREEEKVLVKGKPLIALPTTSGSGSEATHFAVVYLNGKKYSLAHPFILPDYAIIDPSLTFSLPKKITAETGMDALSQAIESYWAVGATEESKHYSSKAIRLILAKLPEAVNNPSLESRNTMSEAAHLAGKAINIAKTTAPHAISYIMTHDYKIPHGHAVALTLGKMFVHNSRTSQYEPSDSKGKAYVDSTMQELYNILEVKDPDEACSLINTLMKSIGLETRLTKLGLDDDAIGLVTDSVNLERLSNNPVKLTKEAIRTLLFSIK